MFGFGFKDERTGDITKQYINNAQDGPEAGSQTWLVIYMFKTLTILT